MEPLSKARAKELRIIMLNVRDKTVWQLKCAQHHAARLYARHNANRHAPKSIISNRQQKMRAHSQKVQNLREILYLIDKALRENLGGMNAGFCGK